MPTSWVFQGRCWKFGDNIPTDAMTPTHVMFKTAKEMAAFVLETLNPEFPRQVRSGDILIAGRNFGCSSGRALATKALQATGIGAVVAEQFSRTFYRNCHEIGHCRQLLRQACTPSDWPSSRPRNPRGCQGSEPTHISRYILQHGGSAEQMGHPGYLAEVFRALTNQTLSIIS